MKYLDALTVRRFVPLVEFEAETWCVPLSSARPEERRRFTPSFVRGRERKVRDACRPARAQTKFAGRILRVERVERV